MAFTLPRLPQTPPSYPQAQIWWQQVVDKAEAQEALQDAIIADVQQAQADIIAAQTAITTTQTNQAAQLLLIEEAQRDIARIASYTAPTNTLTASDVGATAMISVAAHTRIYPGVVADVAITAGSITGLAFSTKYGVYYDDATLAATSPTFIATTSIVDSYVGAGASRHFVGVITTPADGGAASSGSGGTPPGGGGGEILP